MTEKDKKLLPDEFIRVWQETPDHVEVSKRLKAKGYDHMSQDLVLSCVIALRAFGVKLKEPIITKRKTSLNNEDDTVDRV